MYKFTALAIPTALLASACAPNMEGPGPEVPPTIGAPPGDTPSTAIRDWREIPATSVIEVPSMSDASASWVLPPRNPWAPFQKTTLLMTLDSRERAARLPNIEQLKVVLNARQAASHIAATGLPPGTMWVVDLRGPASVAFGATLSAESREPVSPIMTFNNWPADNESIPAEETLAALVTMRPRPPVSGRSSVPVFMLDAWRLAYRYDHPDDETIDNRYMLTSSDLPDTETLIARGIDHVLYVVESRASAQLEEDDLHDTFFQYQEVGITVSIVDLMDLAGVAAFAPGEPFIPYYGQVLYIDPRRSTIMADASFFHRARGGFGGAQVIYGGRSVAGAYHFAFGLHGGG
jgi:hypothetical protein